MVKYLQVVELSVIHSVMLALKAGCHGVLLVSIENVFLRMILSPLTWYCRCVKEWQNVMPCHVLPCQVVSFQASSFGLSLPSKLMLRFCRQVEYASVHATGQIPLCDPLFNAHGKSRHEEMRVNWISVVSDRSIMVLGWPSVAKFPTGKRRKDQSQGLCSSYPLRYIGTQENHSRATLRDWEILSNETVMRL